MEYTYNTILARCKQIDFYCAAPLSDVIRLNKKQNLGQLASWRAYSCDTVERKLDQRSPTFFFLCICKERCDNKSCSRSKNA